MLLQLLGAARCGAQLGRWIWREDVGSKVCKYVLELVYLCDKFESVGAFRFGVFQSYQVSCGVFRSPASQESSVLYLSCGFSVHFWG